MMKNGRYILLAAALTAAQIAGFTTAPQLNAQTAGPATVSQRIDDILNTQGTAAVQSVPSAPTDQATPADISSTPADQTKPANQADAAAQTALPTENILPFTPPDIPSSNTTKQSGLTAPAAAAPSKTGTPDWVVFYKAGEIGKIADQQYYFGVSSSKKSQSEADTGARLQFAMNVETRVNSSIQEITRVQNTKEQYQLDMNTQVTTELSLKGVSITAQYYDQSTNTYYALIKIPRQDYAAILDENIREELALAEVRMQKQREDQRIAQEQERLRLAKLEEDKKIAAEKKRQQIEEDERRHLLREKEKQTWRAKYSEFIDTKPQDQLISFTNGELCPRFQRYSFSLGILPGLAPFDGANLISTVSAGYTLFQFIEISTALKLQGADTTFGLAYQDIGAKIRLLSGAGDVVKVSLSLGAKAYVFDWHNVFSGTDVQSGGTVYASAVISFPMLLYSHLSVYAGIDKAAVGITTHPLFFVIKDALGIIAEVQYIFDERMRIGGNAFLVQAGLRFKTSNLLSCTLTWENYDQLKFALAFSI